MTSDETVYPAAPFPIERLVVDKGELSASAHKNRDRPLHLDWTFQITFLPLELGDEVYETALTILIEAPNVRRVEDFAGVIRRDTKPDLNIGAFYLFDSRGSCETDLHVHSVRGTKLDVEASVKVDVGDSYIDPHPQLRTVHVRSETIFDGIMVSSYAVQCEADEQKLIKIAQELFDVSLFAPPRKLPDAYNNGILNLQFDPLLIN